MIRFARFNSIPLWLFIFVMLSPAAGCSGGAEQEKKAEAPAASHAAGSPQTLSAAIQNVQTKKGSANPDNINTPPANAEGREAGGPTKIIPAMSAEAANKILAFHNESREILEKGYYALPARIMKNARAYLENWEEPKAIKIPGSPPKMPRPEKGVFNEKEEAALTNALAGMDKAIEELAGHFAALLAYSPVARIREDDKTGRELLAKFQLAHFQYLEARNSWRGIVENRAREAEDYLLQNHPLQRQILAAREMFALIDQIREILGAPEPDRQLLLNLSQNLREQIVLAGKPPFPAAPALERVYRGFLKQAETYDAVLNRALKEGLFNPQKKELNMAAKRCADAYNDFAKTANLVSKN